VNVTPYPLAPVLKDEVPEIEEATRYVYAGGRLLRYGDMAFFENNIRAVDPSFLKMFAFPLAQGSAAAALESPHSIVISKEMNEKYFGSENSLGKTISINNEYDFLVTGILDPLPHNSILQFDFLIPYEFLKSTNETIESFGTNSIQTFVRLQENATEAQVNDKIREFIKTRVPQTSTTLILMPFARIYLHAYFGWDRDPGAIQYVYIFSIIALFVLFIACINFMNLSTARSANRAKEVGLRKVVGAQKHHLIRQFYGESVVYAFIALVFAIIFVTLLLPVFSRLAGNELTWNVAGIGPLLIGLTILTIFTGVVAGSYPALFLSTFQPVNTCRRSVLSLYPSYYRDNNRL
jgi:putative ABC transport system permease protein